MNRSSSGLAAASHAIGRNYVRPRLVHAVLALGVGVFGAFSASGCGREDCPPGNRHCACDVGRCDEGLL